MEAHQVALPCLPSHLTVGQFNALAGLCASRLTVFPTGRAARRIAARCTAISSANVAAAVFVEAGSIRALNASGKAAVAGGGFAASAGAWFSACLPITCLGHDQALESFAWKLLWRSLARSREAPPQPPGRMVVRVARLFGEATVTLEPEALLAEECLENAGMEGPFDLVTATDAPHRAHALRVSVPKQLRLRMLRPPTHVEWRFRFFDVERHLLSYVALLRRRGLGDRFVLYVDAFDTAWLGCRRDLLKAFQELRRPIFFGAEFDLYPAGLQGYPAPLRGPADAAQDLAHQRDIPNCRRGPRPSPWEAEPVEEHSLCFAFSEGGRLRGSDTLQQKASWAVYLNGGVYGGRAAALEVALRKLLARQRLLREHAVADGRPYRYSGSTHQYMWTQYFLDHPSEVALDYGGAFVVNMAQRSVSPKHFGWRGAGEHRFLSSVFFQRPVCLVHANGASSYVEQTFRFLQAANVLGLETMAQAGVRGEKLAAVAEAGLLADRDLTDRIVLDTSLCFGPVPPAASWSGSLNEAVFVVPTDRPMLTELGVLVLREVRSEPSGDGGPQRKVFKVLGMHQDPIYLQGPRKQPNASVGHYTGRNLFNLQPLKLNVEQGDCMAWKCLGRCDLTYMELSSAAAAAAGDGLGQGVWISPGQYLEAGDELAFDRWEPRRYAMGVTAEVRGIGFYKEEVAS